MPWSVIFYFKMQHTAFWQMQWWREKERSEGKEGRNGWSWREARGRWRREKKTKKWKFEADCENNDALFGVHVNSQYLAACRSLVLDRSLTGRTSGTRRLPTSSAVTTSKTSTASVSCVPRSHQSTSIKISRLVLKIFRSSLFSSYLLLCHAAGIVCTDSLGHWRFKHKIRVRVRVPPGYWIPPSALAKNCSRRQNYRAATDSSLNHT